MPRLHGIKDRTPFNIWDCLFHGSGLQRRGIQNSYRLFGNANIGNLAFTNLPIPGQFPGDSTAVITNWYARTNIPDGPLRDSMFDQVIATLNVGCRTVRTMPMSDLLRRKEGTLFDLSTPEAIDDSRIQALELIAKLSYEAHHDHRPEGSVIPLGMTELDDDVDVLEAMQDIGSGWEKLSDVERSRWTAVADAVYRELNPRPFVIVPVRQNFDVAADIFNLEAFNKALVHFDDPNWDDEGNPINLLSAPKGHPAGRPGLWVHLEGWLSRDVC